MAIEVTPQKPVLPHVPSDLLAHMRASITPLSDIDPSMTIGQVMFIRGQHSALEILENISRQSSYVSQA